VCNKDTSNSELICKHELIDKKDRIEKLIANILNNDNEKGYPKLRQIVKENVKDILLENRKLISVSFTALLQTLKADPQMIKLIQNIPNANDGEQHKDDNNDNAIKYLEFNKDSILDLAEKNYENLVEALTNNAVSSAASSSDAKLSLPSSSIFLGSYNQSDAYRIEDLEIYHNSKDDIAD
jgi:F0F1-type ATP synthase gamma subunit